MHLCSCIYIHVCSAALLDILLVQLGVPKTKVYNYLPGSRDTSCEEDGSGLGGRSTSSVAEAASPTKQAKVSLG